MTTSTNDGGPAFPVPDSEPGYKCSSDGMSLRDWFAGMALQGMVAGSQGLEITTRQFAMTSYEIADAMLKERSV